MTLAEDAYNWGANWAKMSKSTDYVRDAMIASFGFEHWKLEYRERFWCGYIDGEDGAKTGDTVSINSQVHEFFDRRH